MSHLKRHKSAIQALKKEQLVDHPKRRPSCQMHTHWVTQTPLGSFAFPTFVSEANEKQINNLEVKKMSNQFITDIRHRKSQKKVKRMIVIAYLAEGSIAYASS